MNDSLENLSDAELLTIIRRGENTDVPGSRYQKAQTEYQIRHGQKVIDMMRGGRGGLSIQVGGDMLNDGTISAGPGVPIDIGVGGNYTSNKGRVIQESVVSVPVQPSIFERLSNNALIALVVGTLIVVVILAAASHYLGINLLQFKS